VSAWVRGSLVFYRGIARSFPRPFRITCGDGLERLGADLVPLVWRDQGVVGLLRLFADLLLHLPLEYASAWTATFKELTMTADPFEGTWKAVNEKSQWDPRYTPEQACIRFESTNEGYLLVAYGIKDGQAVAERPTQVPTDGRRRPVLDLNGRPVPGVPPGAMMFGLLSDARTLTSGCEVDGRSLGAGTYQVSEDGRTLTVTTEGMGLKGPFKTMAVFERVTPDPYLPGA
jgi:hypothetical protein